MRLRSTRRCPKRTVPFFCLFLLWAHAQEDTPAQSVTERLTVTYKTEDFHYRADEVTPVLVYDRTFFARFSPISAGDILKRLPGVSGFGDAGEFEYPQMRGLGPQYTRILINGEPMPGSTDDRTLQIDRIPAHLVERIEILRAPGAADDAQGIGGTINIVLRDEAALGGTDLSLGTAYYARDDKQRARTGLSYAGRSGNLSYLVSGALNKRHNPKRQVTDIFSREEEEEELIFKDETNTLDGDEFGTNLRARLDLGSEAELSLAFEAFSDDREERETATFSIDGEIDEITFDNGSFSRDNQTLAIGYRRGLGGSSELRAALRHSRLELENRLDIGVIEDDELVLEEIESDDTEDRGTHFDLGFTFTGLAEHVFVLGIDLGRRQRDARQRLFEIDDEEVEEAEIGGVFDIEEDRADLYLTDTWFIAANHQLEAGLRLEHTRLRLVDAGIDRRTSELYPSLHYLHRAGDRGRFRISLARTTRRPAFSDYQPFPRRDQPFEGRTTVGNPDLSAERAWGLDIGYEHRFLGHEGLFGFNVFAREIADLIEILPIDDETYRLSNVGDGRLYGFELDMGLPLHALGLPNTSLFGNLAVQESRLDDPYTGETRAFNLQADHVANLSILHTFPRHGVTCGFAWLTRGQAEEILLVERSLIDVGDNLDLLLEARLAKGWSLRLTARNLFDAETRIRIEEYEGTHFDGELIQTLMESETSGRSWLLTVTGRPGAPE